MTALIDMGWLKKYNTTAHDQEREIKFRLVVSNDFAVRGHSIEVSHHLADGI